MDPSGLLRPALRQIVGLRASTHAPTQQPVDQTIFFSEEEEINDAIASELQTDPSTLPCFLFIFLM
jgi:hypothetical protein